MSKICQITGKKAVTGNNVSHSKRRTKRKFNVNLFNKKFYWVEQGIWISLTISAAGTSRYITTKNRKNTTERLELKKYNPILKRVTIHKEIK